MTHDPTAIVLDPRDPIREEIQHILTENGWQVTCPDSTDQALVLLKEGSPPFTLLIAGWDLKGATGVDILKTAMEVVPITRRMLIVPPGENKALINTINTAPLHACISQPLDPKDLLAQAATCRLSFDEWLQKNRYKRVIERQNEQLYEVARRLKLKDENGKVLLREKQEELAALEDHEQQMAQEEIISGDLDLARIMDLLNQSPSPEAVLDLFTNASRNLATRLHAMAVHENVEWTPPPLDLESLVHIDLVALDEADDPPPLVADLRRATYLDLVIGVRERAAGAPAVWDDEDDLSILDDTMEAEALLDPGIYLVLTPTEDKIQIYLFAQQELDTRVVTLPAVLEFARHNGITYGLTDDDTITEWINSNPGTEDPLLLAQGNTPVESQDGSVEYFFEIHYTNPGKILENGSIDFRDRGNVPFVEAHHLLARKTPPQNGIPGKDVYGEIIEVQEPYDPAFEAGDGTYTENQDMDILAGVNGQPHLDAMGRLTVNEEMVINGDVDFKTGNVDFAGNIVVRGTVKQGFTIKGVSLTAQAVEGATIELTGDLSVSDGMANTTVKTVANVHTKFVNNCKIMGFGDLMAFKEVVDSKIMISGKCLMPTGHIIASTISATKGVNARVIGTETSAPPLIKVGLDEHVENLKQANADALDESLKIIQRLKKKLARLEEKDKDIHIWISENSQAKDRFQLAISEEARKIEAFKAKGDRKSALALVNTIKTLQKKAEASNQRVNTLFEDQDQVGTEIDLITAQIRQQEEQNVHLFKQKRQMDAYISKSEADPTVIVQSKIIQGTRIIAPNTAMTLHDNKPRCTIKEVEKEENQIRFHEFDFSGI